MPPLIPLNLPRHADFVAAGDQLAVVAKIDLLGFDAFRRRIFRLLSRLQEGIDPLRFRGARGPAPGEANHQRQSEDGTVSSHSDDDQCVAVDGKIAIGVDFVDD